MPDVYGPSAVSDLLAQIVTPFKGFIGDGAYDGEPVSCAVLNHQPGAQVVIPLQGSLLDRRSPVQPARLCRTCDATLQARFRQHHEGTSAAAAEDGSIDQCVRSEPGDQSWHAGVCESLKSSEHQRFSKIFLYSTAPTPY